VKRPMKHVETTVRVAAPPEALIRAFIDVEAMGQWWGVDRGLVEPREGGTWALAWERSPAGFKYVTTGRIMSLEPGRRICIAELVYFNPERPVLGPMTLTVEVAAVEGGSDVTIRQEGYQDVSDWNWYYDAVRVAWPEVAKSLKRYAELGSENND
jgi:uncharacterized protein YndB with AHSA1/START domain